MLQPILKAFLFLNLLLMISPIFSASPKGVVLEFADQLKQSSLQCLKENKITENLLVGVEIDEGWDIIYPDYLQHLNDLGMNITIMIMPCRGRDPVKSVRQFLEKLPKQLIYGVSVWPTPVSVSSFCAWKKTDQANNCEHLNQLVQQLKRNNISTTIVSENKEWKYVIGDYCQFLASEHSLIWVPEELDFIASFDNFKGFGGWKAPIKKVYAIEEICGKDLFQVYWK